MLPESSTDFQINLILAAFDKNGDGRLNFEDARFSFFFLEPVNEERKIDISWSYCEWSASFFLGGGRVGCLNMRWGPPCFSQ